MTLSGFDLTFDILARTQNSAAVNVLAPALESESEELRVRAARALLSRKTFEGDCQVLLAIPRLSTEFVASLKDLHPNLSKAATKLLDQPEHQEAALKIVQQLQLTQSADRIAQISMTADSYSTRRDAASLALELAWAIGNPAREPNGESSATREQLLRTLTEAVRVDSQQRSLTLVDAFLSAVRWDDGVLKGMLDDKDPAQPVLLDRLSRSRASGVVHLLAGWLARPRIPQPIQEVLQSRNDPQFRTTLLERVGSEPGITIVRNLKSLRPISCLRSARVSWNEVELRLHAPMLRALAASEGDDLRVARFVIDAVRQSDSPAVEAAAAKVLGELKGLDSELVVRSALAASRDEQALLDPSIKTIVMLLDLSGLEGALAEGARKALSALRVDALLEKIDDLHPMTARRLGALIRSIDTDCIPRVESLLRHSVSRFRMRGIQAAVALDIVDDLTDSWRRLFQGMASDHLESRLAAIDALRSGYSDRSLLILQELAASEVPTVQHAAASALALRLEIAGKNL